MILLDVERFVCRYCGWPVQPPDETGSGACCGESFDHVAVQVTACAVEDCDEATVENSEYCNAHHFEGLR